MAILYSLCVILLPAGILYLVHNNRWASKVGAIILCYAAGLLLGNSGLIPDSISGLQNTFSEVTIALGLPLLLFSLNVRSWFSLAGKAMLSMFLAVVSVTAITTLLVFNWPFAGTEHPEQFAGLAVGVYTGGTPNLAAIKLGLSIPDDRYILFHTFDTILGASYLMFMLVFGKGLFGRLLNLPPIQKHQEELVTDSTNEDYSLFSRPAYWWDTFKALALAALLVGLSLGITNLLPVNNKASMIIVCLTTLGLLASLLPPVNKLKASYKGGMYLIYMFSFVVATMADFSSTRILNIELFLFILSVIVLSLLIHALLCRLFNVDVGTFMVTSVACICSPPFVPLFARTLGNPTLLISGFTAGLAGYAIGNYLGISLALALAPYF